MIDERKRSFDEAFNDSDAILRALRLARLEAARFLASKNLPVLDWEDGRVVRTPAEQVIRQMKEMLNEPRASASG